MEKDKKEKLYLKLWIFAGAMKGFLIGGVAELLYLNNGGKVTWLFLLVYLTLIALGLLAGYLLGPIAWKKIYIDGVRGKKYTK